MKTKEKMRGWKCYFKHEKSDCVDISIVVKGVKECNDALDIAEPLLSNGWVFDWAEEIEPISNKVCERFVLPLNVTAS